MKKLWELKNNKPIQYVIGKTYFFGIKFFIQENVFIPRPETEELVYWIIKNHINIHKKLQVFDLCTGSGCIGITLKQKIPQIRKIYAIDFSKTAIKNAYKNAILNHVELTFIKLDILNNINLIPKSIIEKNFINIIVSNPPYVKKSHKKFLHPIIQYEPHHALFVPDEDPIIFYKKISLWIINNFIGMVYVYFEINQLYYLEIIFFLKRLGFINIKIKKDFQGLFRMISAEYKGK
ncbi:N5-glutamine methyltransferase family protein [Blattabacterium cuenoti]|uniref:N5-glutamine methyltransferase family protein n=1 Tax=Blattabacterium cuenoti TaxID=1653831 RepID=UPI001EEB87B0|nr:HemK/PrmC family methyltransferase [Blattabacterium cuenoti]